jgi:hypothetical protein
MKMIVEVKIFFSFFTEGYAREMSKKSTVVNVVMRMARVVYGCELLWKFIEAL